MRIFNISLILMVSPCRPVGDLGRSERPELIGTSSGRIPSGHMCLMKCATFFPASSV
jgi:hypothetical protein